MKNASWVANELRKWINVGIKLCLRRNWANTNSFVDCLNWNRLFASWKFKSWFCLCIIWLFHQTALATVRIQDSLCTSRALIIIFARVFFFWVKNAHCFWFFVAVSVTIEISLEFRNLNALHLVLVVGSDRSNARLAVSSILDVHMHIVFEFLRRVHGVSKFCSDWLWVHFHALFFILLGEICSFVPTVIVQVTVIISKAVCASNSKLLTCG